MKKNRSPISKVEVSFWEGGLVVKKSNRRDQGGIYNEQNALNPQASQFLVMGRERGRK